MAGVWGKYPPCNSGTCGDPRCCVQPGHPYTWKLHGMKKNEAINIIQRDYPGVTVVVSTPERIPPLDFCCNRVILHLDVDTPNGRVTSLNTTIG